MLNFLNQPDINIENFLVLLRIQLKFYIIRRKLAENEKKSKENTRLCVCM